MEIKLEDRLAVTQLFSLTPEEVEDLTAEGITSAGNLKNFRFFTNDFDTETQGDKTRLSDSPAPWRLPPEKARNERIGPHAVPQAVARLRVLAGAAKLWHDLRNLTYQT